MCAWSKIWKNENELTGVSNKGVQCNNVWIVIVMVCTSAHMLVNTAVKWPSLRQLILGKSFFVNSIPTEFPIGESIARQCVDVTVYCTYRLYCIVHLSAVIVHYLGNAIRSSLERPLCVQLACDGVVSRTIWD